MQTDPFNLTFGKQNWKINHNNALDQNNYPRTPTKTFKNSLKTEHRSSSAHQKGEKTNKKVAFIDEICKQNYPYNQQTVQKEKRPFSMMDRERKRSPGLFNTRQSFTKHELNYLPGRYTQNFALLMDLELKKKLREMETVTSKKCDRLRVANQNRLRESIYNPHKCLDKYKLAVDPTIRKLKHSIEEPIISRYKDDIVKLDLLIEKINKRIKISGLKM